MRKIIAWEFISLNGIVESPDQWIEPYQTDDVDAFIKEQNLASDAILLGRRTYEALITFWPFQTHNEFGFADKLNAMPKFVVSSTLQKAEWNNTTIINENMLEEVARLKQQPIGGSIGMIGSPTLIQALSQAGLIDIFHLLVYPIVLDKGMHFFQDDKKLDLKLIESRPFRSGVVLLSYQLDRKAGS